MIASEPVTEREHKLSLLLDLGALLAREVDLDALLAAIGTRIARALQAERATVYLVDAATGDLRSRVADLPELREIRLTQGQGVAGWVAETGRAVNLSDASKDPRYFPGVDRRRASSPAPSSPPPSATPTAPSAASSRCSTSASERSPTTTSPSSSSSRHKPRARWSEPPSAPPRVRRGG